MRKKKESKAKLKCFRTPLGGGRGGRLGRGRGGKRGGGGDRDSYDSEESTKPNQIYTMSDKQRERKGLLPPSLVF